MTDRLYVLYDERAIMSGSDNASVLFATEDFDEAKEYSKDVFGYDHCCGSFSTEVRNDLLSQVKRFFHIKVPDLAEDERGEYVYYEETVNGVQKGFHFFDWT